MVMDDSMDDTDITNLSPSEGQEQTPEPYPFKFVTREEWGALPPTSTTPFNLPLMEFTYKFTKTDACNNREDCVRNLQEIQRNHMQEKGLPDIAYNFIIGGDLTVYEGRGWFVNSTKLDEELKEHDGKSLDIAYMGYPRAGIAKNFYSVAIMDLRDDLIEYGVSQKFLEEYTLWDRIHNFDD